MLRAPGLPHAATVHERRSKLLDRLACVAICACTLGIFSSLAAQEVNTGAVPTEQMRSLLEELARAARGREASDRIAADLRSKLTTSELAARDGAVALDLERARTEVAEEKLRSLQGRVEQLEAALAVEQSLNASAATLAAPILSPCAVAAQGKIKLHHNGSTLWDAASLNRLCTGAGSSIEPARCYDRLMGGQVSWGGGSVWQASNALALCAGTRSASRTIACFSNAIASGHAWRSATQLCIRSAAPTEPMTQTLKKVTR